MRINHNVPALNTYRHLNKANSFQQGSMQKLSSGLRINNAADDAAGLAISEKMRAQVRGLDQAAANAQDGISLIQTAEGALQETQDILQRMRELAVQSSNDTNTEEDRAEIQKEINQLTEEVERISKDSEFNTQKLLDGSYNDKVFHIGANTNQNVSVSIQAMGVEALGVGAEYTVETTVDGDGNVTDSSLTFVDAEGNDVTATWTEATDDGVAVSGYYTGTGEDAELVLESQEALADAAEGVLALDVSSQATANAAIKTFDDAINTASSERSRLGAIQNRLEHTINNLSTSSENLTSAESRIRDVDMAAEIMELTKNSILAQASQAMLAQANQVPQTVLQLLQ